MAAGRFRLAELEAGAPVLILAPTGRDADAIARIIVDTGLLASACRDVVDLCGQLNAETPMLIVSEEGLASNTSVLIERLDGQPAWSDLPILLISAGGQRRGGDARWRLFERLGNVTLLDRPLHIGSLKSAIRAAVRGRRRQYQARSHLLQLERARGDLEQRVAERSRQLEAEMAERQRVEQALARAQRLEAIGQLTGGVAHDFNNLLQVIIGGVSMLERHGANAERRVAVIDAMRHASERGAKLTQQLLAFARRQPLLPEPVDAALRIEEMTDLLRGSLRADLKFHLRLAPELWPVKVDPTQLEVAILNLAINARDATGAGGTITLSAENVTLSPEHPIEGLIGDYVRVTVKDNGVGMDEETVRRAVEPFFTTKPLARGTGLGLSQVYGFAQQSGGGVHIESAMGQGTSVCMFIPRGDELPPAPTGEAKHQRARKGGRILVVEDEAAVAELACEMLRDLGYDCEHAPDAEHAQRLDLSRFTAVFSDVVMPGSMDGIALALQIRDTHPVLPILLTTGFAGMPERIADAGFPVLSKPYNIEQLSDALSGLLSVVEEN